MALGEPKQKHVYNAAPRTARPAPPVTRARRLPRRGARA